MRRGADGMAKRQSKLTGVILGPTEREAVEQVARTEGLSLSAVVRRSVRRDLVEPAQVEHGHQVSTRSRTSTVVDPGPRRGAGE